MNRRKMATSTIQQGDVIHHQNTVTLHHLGSLAGLKSDGNLFAYTVSTDSSTQDLILYHSQNNGTMDFLLEGENGGSSSESIANILDEGLGTSLDGTDEISSSIHSTLGRNDSGVFSSDEMTTSSPNGTTGSTTTVVLNNNNNNSIEKNKGAVVAGGVVPATVVVKTTTAAAAVPVASNTTMTTSNNAGTTTALSVVSSSTSKTARPKNSSPNRQGPQRCVVCGKVFSNASALTKHKLTHSDERKHACVMCGKAFKRQDHLNGHMLTHRNKKPFECKAKGCGKSYCDGRSLRRHIESRHGPEALATLPIQASSSTSASLTPISNEQQQPSNNNNNNNNNSSSSIIIPKKEVVSSLVIRPENNEKMIVLKKAPTAKNSELTAVEAGMDGKSNILLGLESNPLDKNNFIQARDIQVALQPVVVKEEQQQHPPIKIEPIQISDSSQILGLTLSTPNGTLCGIVGGGGGDGSSLRNSIALSPASAATTTTSTAPTSSSSATTLPTAVPVTIRTTHSQLHQLLTQRASSTAGNPSILNLRAATIKTEPGLGISTPTSTSSSSFDSSWATTPDAEKSLTGLGSGAAAAAVATILSNVVGKCPTSPTASSSSCSTATGAGTMGIMTNSGGEGSTGQDGAPNPNLLKQQLELIHQIIQQAQEESNLAAAAAVAAAVTPPAPTPPSLPPPTTLTTSKVLTGKMTKAGVSRKVKGVQQIGESGEDEILGKGGSNSNEEKPVECTICCRRFKNTPALNGHMRLHGGYFKKDAEGKKKDAVSSGKEPSNATPLQTASVSVRALIEEKIIQKRNTIQGFGQQQSQPSETSATTTTTGTENNVNMEQDQTLNVNISSSFPQSSSGNGRLNVVVVSTAPVAASTSSSCSSVGGTDGAEQSFQFVYGDDTSDYLLTEEEVFNEVSSICPDSFLNVIDESILNGAAGEQLPPEWNWATTSAGVDSANSRLTSLFVGADSSPSDQQLGATVSTSSFTPLASLDGNNFYTSPTPQSPSVNSQDSPSFSYPTPPASLESHNALQSPLFPFPSIANGASPATGVSHSAPSNSFPSYESTASSTAATTGVINKSSTAAANPIITNALTSSSINNNNQQQQSFASLVAASDLNQIIAATLTGSSSTAAGTVVTRKVSDGDVKNTGGTELNVLTPSSSPSLTRSSSSSSNVDDSQQISMKELKVNEPLRMTCATTETSTAPTTTDIFLSPNSLPSSNSSIGLQKMGVKRKQVRNTFASNLRPQTNLPYKTHFTPYPILSPVRSAPGLFWTFSPKLSHVDDAKRESPKVNIGSNFQAEIPEFSSKKPKLEMMDDGEKENAAENELWKPQVAKNCALEELDNYLAFACCSAIPGGGRNKEYALHVLNHCNGDIVDAMVFLMNPNPSLPNKLRMYKYQEKDKWTMEELALFQEALLRFGKDFSLVAKQVRTKGREECVSFYHVWKKVFAQEYEEARAVWKLSDGKFTEELLKTVPPPPVSSSPSPLNTSGRAHNNNNSLDGAGSIMMMEQCSNNSKVPNTRLDASSPSCDSNGSCNLVGGRSNQSLPLEEYPCKVCGKIFNKVRSRSAHMKSHRPPESADSSNGNKKGKAGGNSSKLAPPLTTMTTTTLLTSPLSSSPPPASPIKTMAALPPPLPLQQIIKTEPGTVPATPSASNSSESNQLPIVPRSTSVVTRGGATDALISEGNSGGRET